MSFSAVVKEELLRVLPEKPCCMLSEISALTQSCASMRLTGFGKMRVVYEIQNTTLAKRLFILLKRRLLITPTLEFARYKRLGGMRVSVLTVSEEDSRKLLKAIRMIRTVNEREVFRGIPRAVQAKRCCRASFVRASFLGGGYMADPENEARLEFVASPGKSELLVGMLQKSGIEPILTDRRTSNLVLLRKWDDIAACLALMGAHVSLLQLENIRIKRDGRNIANRALNCDTANLNRQTANGKKQAEKIRKFSLSNGLSALPDDLNELARLRLLRPDASLEELGGMLAKPIGKSGVNHRMRKLMEIIDNHPGKEG